MVSSEDEEVFGVFDLVREEQADGLEGLFSSIDVVTEEKVVGFWGEPAVFEKPQEVVVLPMNVTYKHRRGRYQLYSFENDLILVDKLTANLNGGFQLEKDRLVNKDFPSLRAEVLDFVLLELNRLSGPVASYWCKTRVSAKPPPHVDRTRRAAGRLGSKRGNGSG